MSEVNKCVARAIVEVAIFLEFSKEDAVAPGAFIQALEQLAATLQIRAKKGTDLFVCSVL